MPPLELSMRFVKLFVAGSVLLASGMGAAAVEMVKPFEALDETRRFNIEFDKRQNARRLSNRAGQAAGSSTQARRS